MDDKSPDRGKSPPSLASALRSARAEAAERSQSMADLRGIEMSRLEVLHEALGPVLAQVPDEVDLFDTGLVPGERPRLFIDMISFIDMARDRRTYRFHLDTRHGRVLLAETESLRVMTQAVTAYIARRLVEREKALASQTPEGLIVEPVQEAPARLPPMEEAFLPAPPPVVPPRRLVRGLRWVIDGLGVAALGSLVCLGIYFLHGRFSPW